MLALKSPFGQPPARASRRSVALIVSALAVLALPAAQSAAHPSKRGTHRATHRHNARASARGRALLVGSFNGIPGQYASIQEAVNAARPFDWILVGPGDYKQVSSTYAPGGMGDDRAPASVLITTPNLHLRGMNRNTVMLDGTKPGSPQCSSAAGDQTFGPATSGGGYLGDNGVLVYKASGVHLQNFSTCNFLGGDAGGDAVWFDGGGASGKQAIGAWWGEYLSATSTYWGGLEMPNAKYGIYASNTYGKGLFNRTYAGNMSDSGYYLGACPNCNATIDHSRAEGNDLGYSGSNSGGHLTIQNSVFNNNEEGIATQSQNNDDAPSPQDGLCPGGATNPKSPAGAQRTNVCWVVIHNQVTNNNNGATPTASSAPGLLGTGMTIAGGRHDLVIDNNFSGNNAWGVLLLPYPATETPPPVANCNGGVGSGSGEHYVCLFEDFANEVANNTFSNNGSYGNPTNGDIGEVSNANSDGNCWHGNVRVGGGALTSSPPEIQTTHGTCGQPNSGEPTSSVLAAEAACDSQLVASCPEGPGEKYPRSKEVKLLPLPPEASLRNPCAGAPENEWCPGGVPAARRRP